MSSVSTRTGEVVHVSPYGEGVVTLAVDAPLFGRIATVSLERDQVMSLIAALSLPLADREAA